MSKEKYSKREQELRDRLAETTWKNRKLEKQNKDYSKKIENHNLIKGMVLHDLNSPLGNISNANYMIRNQMHNSNEEKEWMHDQIERNAEKSLNVARIINLSNMDREGLRANRETFTLEEIATKNASTISKDLEENNLILNLKYDQSYEQPIQVYSDKSAFFTIWTTLTGNCLNYAPENTKIKQGFRFDNSGDLELIMENNTDEKEKRKLEGLGKGYGLKFVEEIIRELGGQIQKYNEPVMDKSYNISQKYGNKDSVQNEGDKYSTFAIKMTIPKNEITEQKE